jgi:deoxyribodipyrimidine photo-lyase
MKKHLLWFRSDLRVQDNPALYHAMQHAKSIVAVYIHCPGQDLLHDRGARQLRFIDANLQQLKQTLQGYQIELHMLQCNLYSEVADLLNRFIHQQKISALFANSESGVNEDSRDRDVRDHIDIPFYRLNGDCILAPGSVLTQKDEMFKVFTAFRNAWIKQIQWQGFSLAQVEQSMTAQNEVEQNSEQDPQWPAGEKAALNRLNHFCQQHLIDYAKQRDFPIQDKSSKLSPYLAIGVISAKQCMQAIESTLGYLPLSPGETGFAWLNELVWRDFYRHLMMAYPAVSKHSCFKTHMNHLLWRQDEDNFLNWCKGKTGYPIIDAAMRCLNQTGWMHNRLRMIVASFLTKDLQIDWRRGEQYFMQQLIDGDFASNNGGWQWAAGTGADAAPYFRIFNPTRQGEKFDKQGEFIKLWVEELKDVPEQYIHKPQVWFKLQNIQSSYPQPVVDHNLACKQTLLRYQNIKVQ